MNSNWCEISFWLISGHRKLFSGGGGGWVAELSKSVSHRGWPKGKNLKKNTG